jgi:hypothetical protein
MCASGRTGCSRRPVKDAKDAFVDCSTIGMDESAEIRARLDRLGVKFLCRAGERQSEMRPRRKILLRRVGSEGRL